MPLIGGNSTTKKKITNPVRENKKNSLRVILDVFFSPWSTATEQNRTHKHKSQNFHSPVQVAVCEGRECVTRWLWWEWLLPSWRVGGKEVCPTGNFFSFSREGWRIDDPFYMIVSLEYSTTLLRGVVESTYSILYSLLNSLLYLNLLRISTE